MYLEFWKIRNQISGFCNLNCSNLKCEPWVGASVRKHGTSPHIGRFGLGCVAVPKRILFVFRTFDLESQCLPSQNANLQRCANFNICKSLITTSLHFIYVLWSLHLVLVLCAFAFSERSFALVCISLDGNCIVSKS